MLPHKMTGTLLKGFSAEIRACSQVRDAGRNICWEQGVLRYTLLAHVRAVCSHGLTSDMFLIQQLICVSKWLMCPDLTNHGFLSLKGKQVVAALHILRRVRIVRPRRHGCDTVKAHHMTSSQLEVLG